MQGDHHEHMQRGQQSRLKAHALVLHGLAHTIILKLRIHDVCAASTRPRLIMLDCMDRDIACGGTQPDCSHAATGEKSHDGLGQVCSWLRMNEH